MTTFIETQSLSSYADDLAQARSFAYTMLQCELAEWEMHVEIGREPEEILHHLAEFTFETWSVDSAGEARDLLDSPVVHEFTVSTRRAVEELVAILEDTDDPVAA